MSDSTMRPAQQASWLPLAFAVAVTGVLMCSAAPLTQSDGDLFAHIALGREILAHGPPARITPAWGSAALFAFAHAYGGLALVAACTAMTAGLSHALAVRLLLQQTSSLQTAFVAAMVGFTLASSHWLARPHAFTLLGMAVLMAVLHSGQRAHLAALVPLFALWANLHGGWIFGALVLLCHVIGRTLARAARVIDHRPDEPRQLRWLWLMTVGAILATLLTPYGFGLHRAVLQTVTDPAIAQYIDEYRPPSFSSPVDALFLAIVLLAIPVLIRRRRPIALEHLMVIILSAAAALRAGRHIALFAFTGWPLLVIHAAPMSTPHTATTKQTRPRHVPRARRTLTLSTVIGVIGVIAIGVTIVGIGSVATRSGAYGPLIVPVDSTRFPVGAVARLERAGLPDRLLTTWSWSGYVPYAWRGHRAWFDPLAFSPNEMRILGTLLLTGPAWRRTIDSLHLGILMVPPGSPLDRVLSTAPAWQRWYADRTAVVYRRRRALTASPDQPNESRRHRE